MCRLIGYCRVGEGCVVAGNVCDGAGVKAQHVC